MLRGFINTLRSAFAKPTQPPKEDVPLLVKGHWFPDSTLREYALRGFGGRIFNDDVRELIAAVDSYNDGKTGDARVEILLRNHYAEQLDREMSGQFEKKIPNASFFAFVIGNKLYEADYFNDMVMNTGFRLYAEDREGRQIRFLCGLPKKMAFESVVNSVKAFGSHRIDPKNTFVMLPA